MLVKNIKGTVPPTMYFIVRTNGDFYSGPYGSTGAAKNSWNYANYLHDYEPEKAKYRWQHATYDKHAKDFNIVKVAEVSWEIVQ